ncbi:MAG TPA: WxL domain-containing protein [Thermomicrobiales bacterium]
MILKKVLGLAAAALVAVGISGSALADAPTKVVTYQITQGTQLSVVIDSATNFGNSPFTLGVQNSATASSASYNYTVTDMRGNGKGWNLNVSSSDFTDGDGDTVPGAKMQTSNNLWWNPATSAGYTAEAHSVTNGITYTSNFSNIIGAGRNILQAAPGTLSGVYPNGTGVFHSQEALFLEFPNAVAAGTYKATITLTLTSAQP